MPTTAQDVVDLLPADRRVGEIEVLSVKVVDDFDSQGDDAVRVLLTLADPDGDTWVIADLQDVESRIMRGLVRAGEDRSIIITLRPAVPEPREELDDGKAPLRRRPV